MHIKKILAHYFKPLYFLIVSLYITEFMGASFLFMTLTAVLRHQGGSLDKISFVYLVGIVPFFKFLFAPIIDKFNPGLLNGHFKNWLIIIHLVIALAFFTISQLDFSHNFNFILFVFVVVDLLSSIAGMTCDGFICKILKPHERGYGSSTKNIGHLLGFVVGGGGGLILYDLVGWGFSLWIMIIGTLLPILQLFFFKEPQNLCTNISINYFLKRFITLWKEASFTWFITIILIPIGMSIAYSLITPILVDSGWSLSRLAFVVNIIGPILGIVSSYVTGIMITYFGDKKAAIYAMAMQFIAVVSVIFVVLYPKFVIMNTIMLAMYFFGYNPLMVIANKLMIENSKIKSPTTDYSIQSSLMFLSMHCISSLSIFMAARIGYLNILLVAIVLLLILSIFIGIFFIKKRLIFVNE